MTDAWNRCDDCGKFIPLDDFVRGAARRWLLEPSSDLGTEKWCTECRLHNAQPPSERGAE